MAELSEWIQRSDSSAEDDNGDRNGRCEYRIAKARDKQQSLNDRYEALRRNVSRATAGGRELSSKEKAWTSEIRDLAAKFGVGPEMEVDGSEAYHDKAIDGRFHTVSDTTLVPAKMALTQAFQVRVLSETLLKEVEELQISQKPDSPMPSTNSLLRKSSNASSPSQMSHSGVPPKLQKAKVEEAMYMVRREGAVINAVLARLERLNDR